MSTAQPGPRFPATTRPPLTGTDLYDWMALRRVNAGGIARMGDHWFDHGRQIPDYVADSLAALCDSSAVTLAEPDGSGMRRAALTNTGKHRFSAAVPATPDRPAATRSGSRSRRRVAS